VAFARLDPDRTASRDILNRATRLLHPAATLEDEQYLHTSVRVPGRPRRRLKRDAVCIDQWLLADSIDSRHGGGAGEVLDIRWSR
jgi:hypothetical protein